MKNRSIAIQEVQREAATCTICRDARLLYQHEQGSWAYPVLQKKPTCKSGILAIMEAPNFADTFDPSKGHLTIDFDTDPTGRFIHELFGLIGISTDDVLFTNSVICLPARKNERHPVSAAQMRLCSPWLARFIEASSPSVVVTFGNTALDATRKVEKHSLVLKNAVGQAHPWYGRSLCPLYHPGRLGRLKRPATQQKNDIRAVLSCL